MEILRTNALAWNDIDMTAKNESKAAVHGYQFLNLWFGWILFQLIQLFYFILFFSPLILYYKYEKFRLLECNYGPAFCARAHSMANLLFIWKIFIFLRKWLGATAYFVLFYMENKIRKKTLSVTPYLEMMVYENIDEFEGQVTYREGTIKRL